MNPFKETHANRKKLLLFFFAVFALMLLVLDAPASAAESFGGSCENGLIWSLDNGTLTLSGADTVPSYTATERSPWYPYRESIRSVAIGSELRYIGAYAFHDCSNLTEINIPRQIKRIGAAAFSGCGKLEKMTLPFVGASNDYIFENNNIDVFGYIFGTEAYPGSAVAKQYHYTHRYGHTYTDYHIPASLRSVTITGGNLPYGSFWGCSNLKEVVLPSVDTAGDAIFHGCTGLTSVVIQPGLEEISHSMFYECSSLEQISLPESLTKIDTYGFGNCSSLRSITIPSSVEEIWSLAFYRCEQLQSVQLPEGLKSISAGVFQDCVRLTRISFPSSLDSIGSDAFFGCKGLEEFNLPAGLTQIGVRAFYGCPNVKKIRFEATALSDLTPDNHTFFYCGRKSTGITVTVSANVTRIPAYLFNPSITEYYYPAVQTVVFEGGSGCQSIGTCAFRFNRFLKNISLPAGVQIGSEAFLGCSSLPNTISYEAWGSDECTDIDVDAPLCMEGAVDLSAPAALPSPTDGIQTGVGISLLLLGLGCCVAALILWRLQSKQRKRTVLWILLGIGVVLILGAMLWLLLCPGSAKHPQEPTGSETTEIIPSSTQPGTSVVGSSGIPTVTGSVPSATATAARPTALPSGTTVSGITSAPTVPGGTAATAPATTVEHILTTAPTPTVIAPTVPTPTAPKPTMPTVPPATMPQYTVPQVSLPEATAPSSADYTLKVYKYKEWMATGETQQLVLHYTGNGKITWKSDNPSHVTVSQTGLVTAVGNSLAYITATDGVKSYSVLIRSGFLAFEPREVTLYLGETRQLDYLYYGDASQLEWSVYDESVVKLEPGGKVTAVGEGYATVFVKNGKYRVGCEIRVFAGPRVDEFYLYKRGDLYDGVTKYAGTSMEIGIDARPYEAPEKIVCTSSNPSVVSVTTGKKPSYQYMSDYILNFNSPGTAVITLMSEDGVSKVSYTVHVKAGYDFAPADPKAVVDPEVFSFYVLDAMLANGYRETYVSGWLLLTLKPEQLTYETALSLAHGYIPLYWNTHGPIFQFHFAGVTDRGEYQFYERRPGDNGTAHDPVIIPVA